MKKHVLDKTLLKDLASYLESQKQWAISTLSRCIAFQSTSGNEKDVTSYVREILGELKGEVLAVPVSTDLQGDQDFSAHASEQPYSLRPNLVHRREGRGKGRSLIVCGHTDVVPGGNEGAFSPRVENGYIYGRGACDDKGPLVAWLLALKALDQFGVELEGDLETHVVIEEEVGGNGALALIRAGRKADAVIVLEPSELHIHPACRGALWFRIDVEGRSAHMASIQDGVNAAKEAICVIQSLERYENRLLADSRDHPLFSRYERPVMVNIGILRAGDWPSTLPAHATIEGGVGFLPNRTLAVVRKEVTEAILDGTGPWVRDHHQVSFLRLHNEAYQIDSAHPLVDSMVASCTAAGLSSNVHGMSASCDARLYFHRGGMPAIVFGPGSLRDAHTEQEKIGISDMVKAAQSLFAMTYHWGGWVG
jgi:acetylornithine deacetylase